MILMILYWWCVCVCWWLLVNKLVWPEIVGGRLTDARKFWAVCWWPQAVLSWCVGPTLLLFSEADVCSDPLSQWCCEMPYIRVERWPVGWWKAVENWSVWRLIGVTPIVRLSIAWHVARVELGWSGDQWQSAWWWEIQWAVIDDDMMTLLSVGSAIRRSVTNTVYCHEQW